MTVRVVNNFNTTLAGSITDVATTLLMASGAGNTMRAKLGASSSTPMAAGDYLYATLSDATANLEVVKCTYLGTVAGVNASTGDLFTIVRAQDKTAARAWAAGSVLAIRPCAALFNDAMNILRTAATGITFSPSGLFAGTDVQAALTELNNAARLNAEQVWTAQQTPMSGSATATTSASWDCDATGQIYDLAVGTTDFTLNAPTNVNNRACYVLRVTQHATTPRVITWPSAYKFAYGVDPLLSTTAGSVDIFTFIGAAGNVMHCVGQAKGLA